MSMFRFGDPQWLWLLLLLPLLAMWRGGRGPLPALEYSNVDLIRQVARATRSRLGGFAAGAKLAALALLILALARPQLGGSNATVHASGVDIMLALDVSGSMQSLDFKLDGEPASRLDVVRSVVRRFIAARPDDRIGLIIFAGVPYVVSPVTLDHGWLLSSLDQVQIGDVEDGTAIGSGLAAALNRLRTQSAKTRIVILMTDGQNNSGQIPPVTAAEAAAALGIKVYTIGIGVRGVAPMPVTDAFGRRRIIMEKVDVDEDTLRAIAAKTGAKFYRATDTDSLNHIYSDIDHLEKTSFTVHTYERWQELFSWLAAAALAVLALGFLFDHTLGRRLPA
ncbi:MAG TPA: VWA domain-containing protein [Steroidobacteraceae bacterium]|nr:VWA domain-containing protein [Steroidobacteraceae bacterium]